MFVLLDTNHFREVALGTALAANINRRATTTLLTRNLADFEKVSGLSVENWLD